MIRVVLGALVGLIVAAAGVALFVWLLWWLWTRRDEQKETTAVEIGAEPPPPVGEPLAVKAEVEEQPTLDEAKAEARAPEEAPVADDLKRIEGIGPRIAAVLQEAGITTFAQLADADQARLERILEEADPRLLRLANPAHWPEQAALAAAGEWEALQALQSELKGGRRS